MAETRSNKKTSTARGGRAVDEVPANELSRAMVDMLARVKVLEKRAAEFEAFKRGMARKNRGTVRSSPHASTKVKAKPKKTWPDHIGTELPRGYDAASDALDGARAGGQAQLLAWASDGTLISSTDFSTRRGVERQALAKAAQRNALFGFKVNNRIYYPAVLADVPAPAASAICEALGGMSPGKKLLFLLRPHGALEGRTVAEAVNSRLDRVVELAAAWADEDRAAA